MYPYRSLRASPHTLILEIQIFKATNKMSKRTRTTRDNDELLEQKMWAFIEPTLTESTRSQFSLLPRVHTTSCGERLKDVAPQLRPRRAGKPKSSPKWIVVTEDAASPMPLAPRQFVDTLPPAFGRRKQQEEIKTPPESSPANPATPLTWSRSRSRSRSPSVTPKRLDFGEIDSPTLTEQLFSDTQTLSSSWLPCCDAWYEAELEKHNTFCVRRILF